MIPCPEGSFTEEEMGEAIADLKKLKAPGPDEVTNEEVKFLDDEPTCSTGSSEQMLAY